MLSLPRNVWILTACQSLFMSLSVFMVFVAGIIGSELAPTKSLSTLPVATISCWNRSKRDPCDSTDVNIWSEKSFFKCMHLFYPTDWPVHFFDYKRNILSV